jgi:hypothetical protein
MLADDKIRGLLAVPLTDHFGAAGAWILLGLLSLLLVWPVRRLLQRGLAGQLGTSAAGKPELPRQWRFYRLIAAYGLEGFGYIITGTFLVAAARSTFGPSGAAAAWILAGLAAISPGKPSIFSACSRRQSVPCRRFGLTLAVLSARFGNYETQCRRETQTDSPEYTSGAPPGGGHCRAWC